MSNMQDHLASGLALSRLWADIVASLPQLKSKPYLVDAAELPSVVDVVGGLGFRVVHADLAEIGEDVEEQLLIEL